MYIKHNHTYTLHTHTLYILYRHVTKNNLYFLFVEFLYNCYSRLTAHWLRSACIWLECRSTGQFDFEFNNPSSKIAYEIRENQNPALYSHKLSTMTA